MYTCIPNHNPSSLLTLTDMHPEKENDRRLKHRMLNTIKRGLFNSSQTLWALIQLYSYTSVLCVCVCVCVCVFCCCFWVSEYWHRLNIIIIIITFKGAIRDFLQSPHCAANCLQHVRSSDPDTSVCKSRATHPAFIICNMQCATWHEGTAQLLSLTEL